MTIQNLNKTWKIGHREKKIFFFHLYLDLSSIHSYERINQLDVYIFNTLK